MGKRDPWGSKRQLMFVASMTDGDHDQVIAALARDRDERLARLDACLDTLASNPILRDPDLEAMITAPAATVAGSANLADAVNARRVAA